MDRRRLEKVLINPRAGWPAPQHGAGTSSPSGRRRAVSRSHGGRNPCRKRKPDAGRRLTAGILVSEAKARIYKNRFARPQGALRNERDFSDGTLRLIGLLWSLIEKGRIGGPVLLEEPELSLHSSVVNQIPAILSRVRTNGGPQVIVTTHSNEILHDQGLGKDEVVVLTPGADGTETQEAAEIPDIQDLLDSGLSMAEILLPKTQPEVVHELPQRITQ